MAVQRSVVVVVSLFFMVAACAAQLPTGCPPVDDKNANATVLRNPFDCSTFYICSHGTPKLFNCSGDLVFNDKLKVCDYPDRADCVPLQPTAEPAPAEVVTTKVVVTKIVKEIFKPEDVSVASAAVNNEVTEVEVQPTTARPAVVDADVSVDDVLSKPAGAVDGSQPAVVNADVDALDVNSAVEPVANSADDAADSGLLGHVADADVDLGVL
uniref:Putative tick mucins 4 n=1 Tax=Amblyomma americanum TaxID=6943 RepID=A0A0C9R6H3_AMBAM